MYTPSYLTICTSTDQYNFNNVHSLTYKPGSFEFTRNLSFAPCLSVVFGDQYDCLLPTESQPGSFLEITWLSPAHSTRARVFLRDYMTVSCPQCPSPGLS